MTASAPVLPLLVFEAADCLMRSPRRRCSARKKGTGTLSPVSVDLGEYFGGRESDGPWLRWVRGTTSAWLRFRRVIDVVPVTLAV